jgi:hypothetical protein
MKNLIAKVGGLRTFVVLVAQAAYILPVYAEGVDISSPGKVVGVICNVASAMFWILIALSTVMVLYGAFVYLTAGADAEKVKTAHKTITYAAVGIVVALLAKGFPSIVASIVGGNISGGC